MSTTTPLIQGAAPGVYAMDPTASTVAFLGTTMFGLVRVPGTISVLSGNVVISEAGSMVVNATLDASSFHTDHPKADEHMISSRFLDAVRFPTISYTSTVLESTESRNILNGELTLHGTTKPLVLSVDVMDVDGDLLRAHATGSLIRYDFGITSGRVVMAGKVAITLDVIATNT